MSHLVSLGGNLQLGRERERTIFIIPKACTNKAWDKGGFVYDEVTDGGKSMKAGRSPKRLQLFKAISCYHGDLFIISPGRRTICVHTKKCE